VDFVVGTFSKSLGAIGGFAASDHELFDTLRWAARPFIFTASPSPASIATTRCALRKMAERERRARLWENARRLHAGLGALGLKLGVAHVSPVVAVVCPDMETAIAMWNGLLRAGVYVNLALPPGTPNSLCLLRCSVSAAHSAGEIDAVIAAFAEVGKALGLIAA